MSVFLAVVSTPSMKTLPLVGVSKRLMQRSRVDLPEPDGPNDGDDLPLGNFQRNILEHFQILKFFRDMFDLNH